MAAPKILVIRLSALGDVLFTLPAVEALRRAWPTVTIDWLVEDKAAGMLDLWPHVRRRLVYPRRTVSRAWPGLHRLPIALAALGREVRALRGERYDAVLDFQGNSKSALHRVVLRRNRTLGFAARHSKEGSHLGLDLAVTPGPEVVHRMDKALALVRALAPEVGDEAPCPILEPGAEAEAFAAEATRDLAADGGFLVLHPGTSAFGAFKRWPTDRFALLADRLRERHGLRCLVTWGPGEEDLAREVAERARPDAAILAPRTRSLAALAALLKRARLFVGSDSAPLHLAALQGVPCVALFGPKDPAVYGPRFAPRRVVRAWMPCSPCERRTCPDVLCMEEIHVRQVYEAAGELLHEAGPPAGVAGATGPRPPRSSPAGPG